MSEFSFIKTMPSDKNHTGFRSLLNTLYSAESLRFKLGNDPIEKHLEGCYLILRKGTPVSRFAFYENPALTYQDKQAACFGSYECIEDEEVANYTLSFVKELAKRKGYAYLIGPMEGSTWNNHRFTISASKRAFFTEPTHHDYYVQHLTNHSFHVISNYISNEDNELQVSDSYLDKKDQIEKAGVSIRNIEMSNFNDELQQIAQLSNDAFKNNFLFTPIEASYFIQKYKALVTLIDPKFVNIAASSRGIEAFSFSIPDYFDANQPSKTLILKSMARRKDATVKGLGYVLAQKTIESAKAAGYERIIHAFMRTDNFSSTLSEKHADSEPLRRYALFGTAL